MCDRGCTGHWPSISSGSHHLHEVRRYAVLELELPKIREDILHVVVALLRIPRVRRLDEVASINRHQVGSVWLLLLLLLLKRPLARCRLTCHAYIRRVRDALRPLVARA